MSKIIENKARLPVPWNSGKINFWVCNIRKYWTLPQVAVVLPTQGVEYQKLGHLREKDFYYNIIDVSCTARFGSSLTNARGQRLNHLRGKNVRTLCLISSFSAFSQCNAVNAADDAGKGEIVKTETWRKIRRRKFLNRFVGEKWVSGYLPLPRKLLGNGSLRLDKTRWELPTDPQTTSHRGIDKGEQRTTAVGRDAFSGGWQLSGGYSGLCALQIFTQKDLHSQKAM